MSGKKTYLTAALLAAAAVARYCGWLDEGTYQAITGLLTGAGLAALRAGVAKIE